ncbi:uncharacterized protein LOC126873419 [Bombus huntii]|uniref:uncharacterized protein LOC126873419 n=1 Tax=Bombus huntii TaxID=85661 RepID=UPI0021A9C814|nr:uncharacterized protein LOC126873419 [Bombus huntii]
MPQGTGMVCYADDTLVLAGRRWWNETVNLTEDAVACAIHAIHRLGLSVSPAKSEALWFFENRRRGTPPPELSVTINGEEVPVRRQMSLTIDSQWTFGPHFKLLIPRVIAAANALCGLLPNIGGAGLGVRRTLRENGPVPSPLRGSRMGRRPDGESPQPNLAEEVAEDDRHPHSEGI